MKINETILWIPGWGMSSSIWDSWQQSLPEYNHVSVDFSQMDSPSAFYQKVEEAYFGNYQEIPSPVFVVGWSLGGMLAQRLAATFPVIGLVLINTTARFVRDQIKDQLGWPTTSLIRMKRSITRNRYEVLEHFYRSMFPTSEEELAHEKSRILLQRCNWTEDALLAGLDILLLEDCRPLLANIHCPCLLFHSFDDPVIPYTAALEMAESIPNTTLLSPDYQGHYPFVSDSSYVSNEIRRFIRAK
ncbi:alpha/beta hydrolase [Brevibacillus laterosporus]|uniref:alpha/beta fold hydrolase n=1 Tax=Brevibacillus laterosporus TaxID=1465 RepID=UPI000CE4B315|nr:alpha/beta hydrolase [Brevibacillus laterosporus]MBG9797609.1 pimeloyl-CoA synthetase [Brevibacillus laterosporus]MCR8936722.1 alpha/beta hydrolase [Brevibacillus laterosporus]MCZ0839361.1 alpha/beta hydrolase [Brevibacillus laterosporus]MCZ0844225.1 alpha/beta hydrolase [Brevibacillus laterosporus]MED1911974.1 alpha/beta hydrolase [Brevibacillus laterosporus]